MAEPVVDMPRQDAETALGVRYLTGPMTHRVAVSVVTLLRRPDSYARLLESFRARGFSPANSEFIALDNRGANRFDGYQMVRRALPECSGRWIFCCHDDIELVDDGFDELVATLEALEAHDPRWCVAGVGGGLRDAPDHWVKHTALHVSDVFGARRVANGPFPRRVDTLDECVLILPRERAVAGSLDLDGFHFFGSDLCLQAEIAGGTSYVVGFHLMHHGAATLGPSFTRGHDRLRAKYRRLFPGRQLHTTTRIVRMGGTPVSTVANLVYKTAARLRRARPHRSR